MSRSYLVYEGPGDLCVEMGDCAVIPIVGDVVNVDGVWFTVRDRHFMVYVNGVSGSEQCAVVTLRKRRKTRRTR